MNYIKQLQSENTELKQNLANAREELISLEVYLTSAKFHQDTTVQTTDVLRRLANLKTLLV